MSIDPDHLIGLFGSAFRILSTLIKIGEFGRNHQPGAFAEAIQRMRADTFITAGRLEALITNLRNDVGAANFVLGTPVASLQSDMQHWREKHDKLFQGFWNRAEAVTSDLAFLVDDIVAAARCAGQEELVAASFGNSYELKEQIRRDTDPQLPIGSVLEHLTQYADYFRETLRNL